MGSPPQYLIGTASWTDPTLVKSDTFYPSSLRTAEERLRFYADQFNAVEVDASYYALLSEKNAQLWAERTPPGFVFDVSAPASCRSLRRVPASRPPRAATCNSQASHRRVSSVLASWRGVPTRLAQRARSSERPRSTN